MPHKKKDQNKLKSDAQSATSFDPEITAASTEADSSATDGTSPGMRELQTKSNQLYRAANELQRTNRFQAMILDSINQGIVVVDEFSQLVAWNDEFLKLYELGKKSLHKGMELHEFSQLFAPLQNSPGPATTLSFNNRLATLGPGEYLDVLPNGAAIEIKVDKRDSGGLIATYTDVTSHFASEARLREQQKQLWQQVTQLKSLGQSLEKARSQAVKSDQEKSRFLAMISHDVRTPMSAIISSLELLSSNESGIDQDRLRQVALDSGRQMLFLLSDIIEVSRSDGWNFTINKEDVAINDLLRSIIEAWQPFAARKSIQLDLTIAKIVPNSMQADPKRLRQVIDNLLSNAIKFTEIGTVKVHVDIAREPTGDVMRICVEDTGRGISVDMQHKLFKEFGRVESADGPKVEGTGLGLSICKRIVESMDGSIGAESAARAGSVFWIELPFVQGTLPIETEETTPPVQPINAKEERNLRVLIADDNEFNRLILSASLEQLGCSSKVAKNGQQAFDLFLAEDFDVVLMDNYMPDETGAEVTRRIRASESDRKSIPIIGITASEAADGHTEMLQAGMTAVYTKPLSNANLRSILESVRL